MRLPVLMALLLLTPLLNACVTASPNSNLIINTDPIGAVATTYTPKDMPQGMNREDILKIKAGVAPEPDYKPRFCDPTPCAIELPRKSTLPILITKEGYLPQIIMIGHVHRKDLNQAKARDLALATAASGVSGGVAVTEFAAGFGTTGMVVSAVALAAVPVIGVELISAGIEANSEAYFELYPNPVQVRLRPKLAGEEGQKQEAAILAQYRKLRKEALLALPPLDMDRDQQIRDLQSSQLMTQNQRKARDKKRAEEQAQKDAAEIERLKKQCANGC